MLTTLLCVYFAVFMCNGSPLADILHQTDVFFASFRDEAAVLEFEASMLETLLPSESTKWKRDTAFVNRGEKVLAGLKNEFLLKNDTLSDINGFQLNGVTYVTGVAVPQNGTEDTVVHLIAYSLINEENPTPVSRVVLPSPGFLEAAKTNSDVVVVVSQPDGCLIFTFKDGFEKTQEMGVPDIKRVKVSAYFGKIFMAVSSPSKVSFYEWQGRYFDLKEEITVANVEALELFNIDSTLYLTTPTSDLCEIWERDPESGEFHCLQDLASLTASEVHYFSLDNHHFLTVTVQDDLSLLYKLDLEGVFQLFQDFPGEKFYQLLPYTSAAGDFALFGVARTGIIGYSYLGSRFRETNFSNPAFGFQKLRKIAVNNDEWIAAVNNLNFGIVAKPLFESRPKEEIAKLGDWCQEFKSQKNSLIDQAIALSEEVPLSDLPVTFNGDVTFRSLNVTRLNARSFGMFTEEFVEKINEIAEMVAGLKNVVTDLETLSLAYTARPIKLEGNVTKNTLTLECGKEYACSIENLEADFMNGDSLNEFMRKTVNIKHDLEIPGSLHFSHLRVSNLTTDYLNSKSADSLLHLSDEISIENLTVDGEVVFLDDVYVMGEVQGVLLDREHVVLVEEDQTLSGRLLSTSATINDLKLMGSLNGADLKKLTNDVRRSVWEQPSLDITNLTLLGNINGISRDDFEELQVESIVVESGIISNVNISDLVRTDKGNYKLEDVKFQDPVFVEDLQVTKSINNVPVMILPQGATARDEEEIVLRNLVGDHVLVLGHFSVKDIVSFDGFSLSKILEEIDQIQFINDNSESDSDELVCGDTETRKIFKRLDENGAYVYEYFGPITVSSISTDYLNITGLIDNVNFTELIENAVLIGESGRVSGIKKFEGVVQVKDLVVTNSINGDDVDSVAAHYPIEKDNEVVVDDLELDHEIFVEELEGINVFGDVEFENGVQVRTLNKINVEDFFINVAYINEDTVLETVNFVHNVSARNLQVKRLNGVNFTDAVVLKSTTDQLNVSGYWVFHNNVSFDGEVKIDGETSAMDLDALCDMTRLPPKVVVTGSVFAQNEPKILQSLNNFEKNFLLNELWLRNERATLFGEVTLGRVQISEEATVKGLVNGFDLKKLADSYLSKSRGRRMQALMTVGNLTILGRARAKSIQGEVNGIRFSEFASSVLQQNITQVFTVRPHFQQLTFENVTGDFTVNEMNLSSDILRYDVEGAVVTGSKTVHSIFARNLTLEEGVKIQEVDVGKWIKQAVLVDEGLVSGNFRFNAAEIQGSLRTKGRVGGVHLDSYHMLMKHGNQKITAPKTFSSDIHAASLNIEGLTNGVDLRMLVKNAAYADRNVSLEAETQLENLETSLLLAEQISDVNISKVCYLVNEELRINDLNEKYEELAAMAKVVHHNAAHGAYYLDYFRMVQKFRLNVTAVAFVPGQEKPVIAIFRQDLVHGNVSLMEWDQRDKIFKNKPGKALGFEGNISFTASAPSLLAIRTENSTKIYYEKEIYSSDILVNGFCVTRLPSDSEACFFLGLTNRSDVVSCADQNGHLKISVAFTTTDCIQATSVIAGNKTWLIIIGGKVNRPTNDVFVTVMSRTQSSIFIQRQDLAILHPVSVTAASHGRYSYLVVASQHQPESVRSSLLSVFRYTQSIDKWTRYQEIRVEAPLFVEFSELPTGQLALYVVTANPARAFLVFIYRGVEGFVEETAGLTAHTGTHLSFFSTRTVYFIGIGGNQYGQVLQPEMRGKKYD